MEKQELEEVLNKVLRDDEVDVEEGSSIDWKPLLNKLWAHRTAFYISIPIAFVVSVLIALSIPKTYSVEVKLASELSTMGNTTSNSLSSLAKTFGLSSSSASRGGDAILPNLYPDLMNSKAFLVSLFDVNVKSKKGDINTTYYDYLANHQKKTWWSAAIGNTIGAIMSLIPADDDEEDSNTASSINETPKADASALTKKQTAIAGVIGSKIMCDVDEKSFVITINVTDQDPVICAVMADSTCQRLQDFITAYRTKKAMNELINIQKQYDKAEREYEEARDKVARFSDSNWDIVDQDMLMEKQVLQNEMQLKFSSYSTISNQLIGAQAKVEELRPVYTVLDGASVPLKPIGPRKSRIVIMLTVLVCVVQTFWILRKDVVNMVKENFM